MTSLNLPNFSASDARPDERMHWVHVPFSVIMELYDAPVLRVQRHHKRRALVAKHLTELNLPVHANYQAGRTPDGKLHLIDGYTRLTILKTGSKPLPEFAWLGIIDVDSAAELDRIYDTVDSKYAVKRGKDAFEEGLRRAGLLEKVVSPLFSRAQAVTAVTIAAGHSDVRKAVWELRNGIRVLDPLHLGAGPTRLPAGALAALLLIASRGGDASLIQKVAATLERPTEVPDTERKALAPALAAAQTLQQRRTDGSLSGKNVTPIMELVLGAWVSLESGASTSTPISRADFLAFEEKEEAGRPPRHLKVVPQRHAATGA